jgi:hypothetical protein
MMCRVPEIRKLVSVVMAASIRVVETMNKGLTVNDELNLLARWCEGFNHE